jgi:hypothetical protein
MSALFDPEPQQWGLRGDPHVWRTMRDLLRDVVQPGSATEGSHMLRRTFQQVVAVDLEVAAVETVYLPEADTAGMSGGVVHLPTWRERLLPMLEARLLRI